MGTFTRGPMWLQLAQHLLLLWLIHYSDATPFKEPTEMVDPSSLGCYYNYNHYSEGDRILTNEPCLNCTCHNKMLMCYLRVCPFTKPIGQDCTIEKRDDQCCPIITCPEVPVELVDHSSGLHSTSLAMPDRYGCHINNQFYAEGAQIPSNPKKPCELCYCIRNMTSCVMQECTLHVEGCSPIYNRDVCCPVRYDCGRDSMDEFLLDESTTTVRPTPGFMLTTTMIPEQNHCVHNDVIYNEGEVIEIDEPCQHCYCMRGHMICAVQECSAQLENMGKQCQPIPPRDGQCCPTTYDCDTGDETTEESLTLTTTTRTDVSTESDNINEIEDEGLTKPLPITEHFDESDKTTLSPLGQRFDLTGESITQSIVDEMAKAQEKLETTTILFPGFDEDIDINTVIPHIIPGEGSCLIDGVTYRNNSRVPTTNKKCDKSCVCLNSLAQCTPIYECNEPVSKTNCQLIEDNDSCCPQYDCTPGVTVSITEVPLAETESSTQFITESPASATKTLAMEDENITELIADLAGAKPTEKIVSATETPDTSASEKGEESPASEKPEEESSASEEPEEESPASVKPEEESLASKKPEEESPASVKPEEESPASEKPEEESPASVKPEEASPASEKPEEEESPASEKPEEASPASEKPEEESTASVKPEEESPASEKPEEESPSSEKPEEESTASVKPKEESPTSVKPEEESPTSVKPEEESPASDKPEEASPASEKPEEKESPASEKPEEASPASEKPEEESTASVKLEEESPASEKPEEESLASEKPDEESSASEKPEEASPASEKPEEESPASEKPEEESPATEEPDSEKPEKITEKSVIYATEQPDELATDLPIESSATEQPEPSSATEQFEEPSVTVEPVAPTSTDGVESSATEKSLVSATEQPSKELATEQPEFSGEPSAEKETETPSVTERASATEQSKEVSATEVAESATEKSEPEATEKSVLSATGQELATEQPATEQPQTTSASEKPYAPEVPETPSVTEQPSAPSVADKTETEKSVFSVTEQPQELGTEQPEEPLATEQPEEPSATEQPEESSATEQPKEPSATEQPERTSTQKESETIHEVTTEPSFDFDGDATTLSEPGVSEIAPVTEAPIETAKTQKPLSAQPEDESTETPVIEEIAVTKKIYTVASSTELSDITTEQFKEVTEPSSEQPESVDLDNRISDSGATPSDQDQKEVTSVPIKADETEGSGATEPSITVTEESVSEEVQTTAPEVIAVTEGELPATQKSPVEVAVTEKDTTAVAPEDVTTEKQIPSESASTETELSSTEVPSVESYTNAPGSIPVESHVTQETPLSAEKDAGSATDAPSQEQATKNPLQEEGSTEKQTEQGTAFAGIEEVTPNEIDVTEKDIISTQKPLFEEEGATEKSKTEESEVPESIEESVSATEKPLHEEIPEIVTAVTELGETEPSGEDEGTKEETGKGGTEKPHEITSETATEPAQTISEEGTKAPVTEEGTKAPVTEEGLPASTEFITDKELSSEEGKTEKTLIEEAVSEPATSKPTSEEEGTTKASLPDEGVTNKSLAEETASESAEVGGTEKPLSGEVQTEFSEQATESGATITPAIEGTTKTAHPSDIESEHIIEEYITKAEDVVTSTQYPSVDLTTQKADILEEDNVSKPVTSSGQTNAPSSTDKSEDSHTTKVPETINEKELETPEGLGNRFQDIEAHTPSIESHVTESETDVTTSSSAKPEADTERPSAPTATEISSIQKEEEAPTEETLTQKPIVAVSGVEEGTTKPEIEEEPIVPTIVETQETTQEPATSEHSSESPAPGGEPATEKPEFVSELATQKPESEDQTEIAETTTKQYRDGVTESEPAEGSGATEESGSVTSKSTSDESTGTTEKALPDESTEGSGEPITEPSASSTVKPLLENIPTEASEIGTDIPTLSSIEEGSTHPSEEVESSVSPVRVVPVESVTEEIQNQTVVPTTLSAATEEKFEGEQTTETQKMTTLLDIIRPPQPTSLDQAAPEISTSEKPSEDENASEIGATEASETETETGVTQPSAVSEENDSVTDSAAKEQPTELSAETSGATVAPTEGEEASESEIAATEASVAVTETGVTQPSVVGKEEDTGVTDSAVKEQLTELSAEASGTTVAPTEGEEAATTQKESATPDELGTRFDDSDASRPTSVSPATVTLVSSQPEISTEEATVAASTEVSATQQPLKEEVQSEISEIGTESGTTVAAPITESPIVPSQVAPQAATQEPVESATEDIEGTTSKSSEEEQTEKEISSPEEGTTRARPSESVTETVLPEETASEPSEGSETTEESISATLKPSFEDIKSAAPEISTGSSLQEGVDQEKTAAPEGTTASSMDVEDKFGGDRTTEPQRITTIFDIISPPQTLAPQQVDFTTQKALESEEEVTSAPAGVTQAPSDEESPATEKVESSESTEKEVEPFTQKEEVVTVLPSAETAAPTIQDVSTEGSTEKEAEKEAEAATEKEAEAATEKEAEAATEKGAEAATEKGAEAATEKGAEAATEKEAEVATEKGAEAVTETGAEAATETGEQAATEKEADLSTEKEAEAATEKRTEAVTEKGAEVATEKGAEVATEKGAESVTEKAAAAATEKGPEAATENGGEVATEAGVEVATEKGIDIGTEAGAEVATEIGTEAATEKGVEGAVEQGVEVSTESKIKPSTEKGVEEITQHEIEGVTEKGVEGATEKELEGSTEKGVESPTEKGLEGVTDSPMVIEMATEAEEKESDKIIVDHATKVPESTTLSDVDFAQKFGEDKTEKITTILDIISPTKAPVPVQHEEVDQTTTEPKIESEKEEAATTEKPAVTEKVPSVEQTTYKPVASSEAPAPQYGNEYEPGTSHYPGSTYLDEDYGEEDDQASFGPGTCRYGGKLYVSAQQIPRDDPCDFCFCFRSDIICLQQSCPPPINGCHEEPIQGFCCPRYECPVSMATVVNVTTSTTTTSTTLPPHFLHHAYKGAATKSGCQIDEHTYQVGDVVPSASGPCMQCICGGDGQMKCEPKQCTPEPMLRQMIATTTRR